MKPAKKREWTKVRVDNAGAALLRRHCSLSELDRAFRTINEWRSSHAFPLNTFQTTLRRKARQVDPKCLVAQRLKRLSSIDSKLRRFSWLQLSEMQDIAGCRAVLPSVHDVDALVGLYGDSDLKHELIDSDDYIRSPKKSGYRGIHLIYSYYSDKTEKYNGLKIEIQFRSRLQHAWATAVETVDTFTRQALKSSQGERDWLRFFQLMSSEMAVREGTPTVPGTPNGADDLIEELRHLAKQLDVVGKLSAFGHTLSKAQPNLRGSHYFLMVLDSRDHRITVHGYRKRDLVAASTRYLEIERQNIEDPNMDAVLVSVDSLQALKRAYPNYYLDTRVFLVELQRAIAEP